MRKFYIFLDTFNKCVHVLWNWSESLFGDWSPNDSYTIIMCAWNNVLFFSSKFGDPWMIYNYQRNSLLRSIFYTCLKFNVWLYFRDELIYIFVWSNVSKNDFLNITSYWGRLTTTFYVLYICGQNWISDPRNIFFIEKIAKILFIAVYYLLTCIFSIY